MTTFGIDLGTTYSCIAHVDGSGRAVVTRSALGEDTTPSVVYFESPANVVVGRSAKDSAMLHPDLVFSLVKRQMGRQVEWTVQGQRHTPESVSALILKELAGAARAEMGETVQDVVITVPAYFGLAEREATRRAGEIAGLHVLNVVPEPVAAALHYDMLEAGEGRTILVFDLGGGTFDTTVIRLEGKDVRVVCTDGDHHLGGADWDEKVTDYLLDQFVQAHPDRDPSGDEEFLQQLAIDAEKLKKDLSSVESRRPVLRFDGAVHQVELTRDKFEELTSELLGRTLEITARTIETAREKGVERFDDVLLVGGATRMPAVTRELRVRHGFEPKLHDPDLAVAKGAAKYALIESVKLRMPGEGEEISRELAEDVGAQLGLSAEAVRDLAARTVTAVAPRGFGIELHDLNDRKLEKTYVLHLLHANDPLPRKVEKTVYTVKDNQANVNVNIWEQAGTVESTILDDNTRIGQGRITELPPLPKQSPIEVTFDLDDVGSLRVYAIEPTSRRDVRIELEIAGLDPEQLQEQRDLVAGLRVGE